MLKMLYQYYLNDIYLVYARGHFVRLENFTFNLNSDLTFLAKISIIRY